jgi:DNA-binding winged helix-turn-helix (wHTH) protein
MKPEDQVARKMKLKGQAMQIGQPASQLKEEGSFVLSQYPPSSANLKKSHPSTDFLLVPVFITAPIEGDQASLRRLLEEEALDQIGGRKLADILETGDGGPMGTTEESTVAFGDVAIDFSRMEAFRKKEPVVLTTLQFKTLRYLTRHARRVVSRDELLNEVWGYRHYPTTRTVDNIILKLRQSLEPNPSRPVHFRTIYGTGYKFIP